MIVRRRPRPTMGLVTDARASYRRRQRDDGARGGERRRDAHEETNSTSYRVLENFRNFVGFFSDENTNRFLFSKSRIEFWSVLPSLRVRLAKRKWRCLDVVG